MRVHVDPEKCQGHNRCYALAPELFDVDDLGNAHELNDGVVPEGLEDKARLRGGQLSRVRDLDLGVSDDDAPARRVRLGHRLRPHRPAVGRRSVPDLGRAARQVPRRPQRPLRRHLAAGAPRGRRGGRVRHRALHVAIGRRQRGAARRRRPPGADRRRAADHLRPAVPRPGAAPAAARRSGPSRSRRSSRSRASCASSCSTPPPAEPRSMRRSTTPSTSRCG